jgi:hypothetical protein
MYIMYVCMHVYIYVFLMYMYVLRMYMCVRGHKAHIYTEFIFLKLDFASLFSCNNSIIHNLGTSVKQHFSQYIQKCLIK